MNYLNVLKRVLAIVMTVVVSFGLKSQNAAITPVGRISIGQAINPPVHQSDVDEGIPNDTMINANLRVMIIANQNYWEEDSVGTALNDGRMMKEYCVRTLGVPEKNVQLKENRTSAQMKGDVEDFCHTMRINKGDRFYFFYYGHGMYKFDNHDSADTYLVPVDGNSLRLVQTSVSRNWMMKQFENANPEQLLVCLESCYSGMKNEKDASGLMLVPDVTTPFVGNIVMVTASRQNQPANAYPDQNHNVFTYELLKALKENGGNATWGDMFERVKRNTQRTAWNELRRNQEPSVVASSTLGDAWKNWSVK